MRKFYDLSAEQKSGYIPLENRGDGIIELIDEKTIELFRESIMGKRVRVKTKDGSTSGTVQYFGYNKHIPSWGLQVTLDRFPILNIQLKDIELL